MLGILVLGMFGQTQDASTVTRKVLLAKDTPVQLMLGRPLSSGNSHVGTGVTYVLAEDVKDKAGDILIPAGTVAAGRVTACQRPSITHWYGLLGISVEAMCVGGGDDQVTIPLRIKESDAKYHDFRTRQSVRAPTPTQKEVATFKTTRQPIVDSVLKYTDSLHRSPSGAYNSFISAGSAIMLAQIIDPKEADQVTATLSDERFVSAVRVAKTANQIGRLVKTMSLASAVTLAGIGIGIWELVDLIRGFFHEATIASGALFSAYVDKDTTLEIQVKKEETRGFWHFRVPILPPSVFAHRHNIECEMLPSPFEKSRRHK